MNTQLSSKGQIVLPLRLRQIDALEVGQVFEIQRLRSGEYLLKKSAQIGKPGLTNWLKSCPVNDWLKPIESESADTSVCLKWMPEQPNVGLSCWPN